MNPKANQAALGWLRSIAAIFLLLLSRRYLVLEPLAIAALWLAVALALVSGVGYFVRFWRDYYRAPQRSSSAATSQPAA